MIHKSKCQEYQTPASAEPMDIGNIQAVVNEPTNFALPVSEKFYHI